MFGRRFFVALAGAGLAIWVAWGARAAAAYAAFVALVGGVAFAVGFASEVARKYARRGPVARLVRGARVVSGRGRREKHAP